MGTNVVAKRFKKADYELFSRRLKENLGVLSQLLEQPRFGIGEPSLGAELELTLIDSQGKAKWLNQQLLALAKDPQLTLEINRYNLEYNLAPVPAAGKPFTKIASDIRHKLRHIDQLASAYDARSIAIGILPSLSRRDVGATAMTDDNRYYVLSKAINKLRNRPLEININGLDPLSLTLSNLNIEGANTSFQVHLRVNPSQFAAMYNAAQLASAAALAISTNSPLLLEHRLWEETRIVLFKQSVETRQNHQGLSRAGFGHDWIKSSAVELFSQSVEDFPVLIPQCQQQNDQQVLDQGGIPELAELRLHHGSIWHWNRAIYDPACNGHLRIEMRALPSGPTAVDMAANAAFMIGLTNGLSASMSRYTRELPFSAVKQNFYRAAQVGLDATFIWPGKAGEPPSSVSASTLIAQLLPVARNGLAQLKVSPQEINDFIGIIEARLKSRQTGARWQLATLAALEQQHRRKQALRTLVDRYLENAASGQPVHQWSVSC